MMMMMMLTMMMTIMMIMMMTMMTMMVTMMMRRATIALQVSPGRHLSCVRTALCYAGTARAQTLTLSAFMIIDDDDYDHNDDEQDCDDDDDDHYDADCDMDGYCTVVPEKQNKKNKDFEDSKTSNLKICTIFESRYFLPIFPSYIMSNSPYQRFLGDTLPSFLQKSAICWTLLLSGAARASSWRYVIFSTI